MSTQRLLSETAPLLPETTPLPDDSTTHDDDAPEEPTRSPREQRHSLYRWLTFWSLFAVGLFFLVRAALVEGGGKFSWGDSLRKALGGGVAGGLAMILQVLTLMPLRTTMNFQYRRGGSTLAAYTFLKNDGGFTRFYKGLGPALIQGPLARFGDTAANVGILALLQSNPALKNLPVLLKTALASLLSAAFRMILSPLDALKTTMQTEGDRALPLLRARIRNHGIGTLWAGAFATAAANFAGSYPWFAMYNYLSESLPPSHNLLQQLLRQAFIGFVASVVSDTVSNSLRVLKTYRQVNARNVSYRTAVREVIKESGIVGLFGRGLGTRILANGLQGLMFSVLWKLFQELLA